MNAMSNPASEKNVLEQYRLALHTYADTVVMPVLRQAVSIRYKEKPEVKHSAPGINSSLLPDDLDVDCRETNIASFMFRGFKDDLHFGGDARFYFRTDYSTFQMLGFKYTNECEVEEISLFLMGDAWNNYTDFDPDTDIDEYKDSVLSGSSWAVPMFHVFFKDGRHVVGPCCVVECFDKNDKKKEGHVDKRRICYEMFEWYTSKP